MGAARYYQHMKLQVAATPDFQSASTRAALTSEMGAPLCSRSALTAASCSLLLAIHRKWLQCMHDAARWRWRLFNIIASKASQNAAMLICGVRKRIGHPGFPGSQTMGKLVPPWRCLYTSIVQRGIRSVRAAGHDLTSNLISLTSTTTVASLSGDHLRCQQRSRDHWSSTGISSWTRHLAPQHPTLLPNAAMLRFSQRTTSKQPYALPCCAPSSSRTAYSRRGRGRLAIRIAFSQRCQADHHRRSRSQAAHSQAGVPTVHPGRRLRFRGQEQANRHGNGHLGDPAGTPPRHATRRVASRSGAAGP